MGASRQYLFNMFSANQQQTWVTSAYHSEYQKEGSKKGYQDTLINLDQDKKYKLKYPLLSIFNQLIIIDCTPIK